MATTLYHGAHTRYTLHLGQCYTDDADVSETYAGRKGTAVEVELDLTNLVTKVVAGYDRDENVAPGDDDDLSQFDGFDVIRYTDEDERGREHDCWRLVSDKAVAAITVKD